MSRLLILMRHAEAVDFAPGRSDHDRPLTDRGHDQAHRAGRFLQGRTVDHALVSGALRTRQTADDLGLGCPVEHLEELFGAPAETIRDAIAAAPAEARTLLVVAHNPGIHEAALALGDLAGHPDGQRLLHSFPTATAVGLVLDGDGWDPAPGRPVEFVRLGG